LVRLLLGRELDRLGAFLRPLSVHVKSPDASTTQHFGGTPHLFKKGLGTTGCELYRRSTFTQSLTICSRHVQVGSLPRRVNRLVLHHVASPEHAQHPTEPTSNRKRQQSVADIEQRIRSATGGSDPAAARDAAVGAVRALVTGDRSQAQAAREQAAAALAQAQNIPIDQAREQVAQYEQQYRQTVEQAKQKAATAADSRHGGIPGSVVQRASLSSRGTRWLVRRPGAVDPTLTTLALGRQRRA